jgi:hypothetical protein
MLLKLHPSHVLFKTDFSNAFNSMYRVQILRAVKTHFPGLYPLVKSVYAPRSDLWTNVDATNKRVSVSSEEGVQQGDALGPFLFCLVLQPLLVKLNEMLNGAGKTDGEVLGEMDDLTMVLKPSAVGVIAEFLSVESLKLGLQLNFKKCELMSMDGLNALSGIDASEDIKRVAGCVKNLGIPIGPDVHCGEYWNKFLDGIERDTDIVCRWSNVQGALVLFRLCITSKLNYMLRSVPPTSTYATQLVHRATAIMRSGFAKILGVPVTDTSDTASWWLQGTLPPTMGGFGIIDPSLIHHVSFLACEAAVAESISALQIARDLPPFQPSEDAHSVYGSDCVDRERFPDLNVLFVESYKLQHRLSVDLYEKRARDLRARDTAIAHRLDSCSEEGSVLVTCIPTEAGFTIADGAKMRERLCMRAGLGIPYIAEGPCNCGASAAWVDKLNFHLLSGCKVGGERLQNHNGVRDALLQLFRQASLTCRPGGRSVCLAHEPGTRKSVDMTVDNFDGLVGLGIDISVIDPRGTKYNRMHKPIPPGKAAMDREKHKVGKYQEAYVEQRTQFEPFVMEAFGRFGNRTRNLFDQVVDRVQASKDQYSFSYLKQYWRARIVMALHICACNGVKDRMDEVIMRRKGLPGRAEAAALDAASEWVIDYESFARPNRY